LSIAGPIVENSPLFLRAKGEENGNELQGKSFQGNKGKDYDPEMNQIKENEGEEED